MKSVTLEEVKSWKPCWLKDEARAAKLEEIGRRKERWTALDVLDLPEDEVNVDDKFWVVLRPELVPEPILHEFACRCAEEGLKLVDSPDPRSVAAVEAKRKWLKGEITDSELAAARDAAWAAADAAWAAWAAADAARDATYDAAYYAAQENQIKILRELINTDEKEI